MVVVGFAVEVVCFLCFVFVECRGDSVTSECVWVFVECTGDSVAAVCALVVVGFLLELFLVVLVVFGFAVKLVITDGFTVGFGVGPISGVDVPPIAAPGWLTLLILARGVAELNDSTD